MVTKQHRAYVVPAARRGTAQEPAQISAGVFKATCLELMDEVERTGAAVVITKRGRAVARLAPVRARVKSAFGLLKGQIRELGDIVSPSDEPWDAER